MTRARTNADQAHTESFQHAHIIPGVLYPAVANIMVDGSTALSASTTGPNSSTVTSSKYGTVQSDGRMYYYTDIKGSKPIKDPRIGAYFGSQRYMFKSLQLLEQETATQGKNIYSLDGREWLRAYSTGGGWSVQNGIDGNFIQASTDCTGCYLEITGYFNDINFLIYYSTNRCDDIDVSVNGTLSVDGSTTLGGDNTVASPLTGRYVNSGGLINGGSTLSASLGTTPTINTVKYEMKTGASEYVLIDGIELIAQDTTSTANKSKIQIPSQNVVSYGKKFTVSGTPHYDPFNGFTNSSDLHSAYVDTATSLGLSSAPGSSASWAISSTNNIRPYNGMRVVKWVDSSGTIKTSVTAMPPNAQNIAENVLGTTEVTTPSATNATFTPIFSDDAIDHSLSEVAKTFNFNEFGNGSANGGTGATYADASMLSSADDIAYVMDDGLTSLSGKAVSRTGNKDLIGDNDDGSSPYYVTFIGTGISVMNTADTAKNVTWFQNLPYGTHIVKVDREGGTAPDIDIDGVEMNDNASVNNYGEMHDVTFHQPKKPPIPEDAVVIADYMLMADFVAQPADSSFALGDISKGVRYLSMSRDIKYDQTSDITSNAGWATTVTLDLGFSQGFQLGGQGTAISAGSANLEIPYFGTDVCMTGYTGRLGSTWTESINSTTISNTVRNNARESRVNTTGQTLQVNGFKTTWTSSEMFISSFEIASPIHTSSHYQSFETPFLHELVGGDRNMEQTNLVVTPDGKSWDELRDTSYLGNACLSVRASANNVDATWSTNITHSLNKHRGTDGVLNLFNKDWAISYNRFICLVDGEYRINYLYLRNTTAGNESASIYINGTVAYIDYTADANHRSGQCDLTYQFKRGDYFWITGAVWAGVVSHLSVTRIS